MLYQWDLTHDPVSRVIDAFWKVRSTTEATREIAERLVRGAAKECETLDAKITEASANWRFERIAAVDKNILRLATYELVRELETPSSVVLDEAIELAKRFGEKDSAPFVNGVLDAVNRTVRPFDAKPRDAARDNKKAKVTKK